MPAELAHRLARLVHRDETIVACRDDALAGEQQLAHACIGGRVWLEHRARGSPRAHALFSLRHRDLRAIIGPADRHASARPLPELNPGGHVKAVGGVVLADHPETTGGIDPHVGRTIADRCAPAHPLTEGVHLDRTIHGENRDRMPIGRHHDVIDLGDRRRDDLGELRAGPVVLSDVRRLTGAEVRDHDPGGGGAQDPAVTAELLHLVARALDDRDPALHLGDHDADRDALAVGRHLRHKIILGHRDRGDVGDGAGVEQLDPLLADRGEPVPAAVACRLTSQWGRRSDHLGLRAGRRVDHGELGVPHHEQPGRIEREDVPGRGADVPDALVRLRVPSHRRGRRTDDEVMRARNEVDCKHVRHRQPVAAGHERERTCSEELQRRIEPIEIGGGDDERERGVRMLCRQLDARAVDVRRDQPAADLVALGIRAGSLRLRGGLRILGGIARVEDLRHRERSAHDRSDERDRCHAHRRTVPADEPTDALPGGVAMREHELAGGEPPQIRGELCGRRIALRRVGRHRARHDRREIRWHLRNHLGEWARRPCLHLLEELVERSPRVRRCAGEQVIEHRADRVDICTLVDPLAARLLRRHVRRRAHDRTDVGLARLGADPPVLQAVAIHLVESSREPPVDHHGLAVRAAQHVVRLEVAVDHPLAMGVRERVGDGEHVRDEREPRIEIRGLVDHHVERPTLDELHREERFAGRPPPDLVDRDDRGVLEVRRDQRLAREPQRRILRVDQHLLDRDHPTAAQIAGS